MRRISTEGRAVGLPPPPPSSPDRWHVAVIIEYVELPHSATPCGVLIARSLQPALRAETNAYRKYGVLACTEAGRACPISLTFWWAGDDLPYERVAANERSEHAYEAIYPVCEKTW